MFNTKRLMALSAGILLAGIAVVFLYDKIVVRYIIILLMAVLVFVFRKQLAGALKPILSKKKKESV